MQTQTYFWVTLVSVYFRRRQATAGNTSAFTDKGWFRWRLVKWTKIGILFFCNLLYFNRVCTGHRKPGKLWNLLFQFPGMEVMEFKQKSWKSNSRKERIHNCKLEIQLYFICFTKNAIYSQIYRDSFLRPEHRCLKF